MHAFASCAGPDLWRRCLPWARHPRRPNAAKGTLFRALCANPNHLRCALTLHSSLNLCYCLKLCKWLRGTHIVWCVFIVAQEGWVLSWRFLRRTAPFFFVEPLHFVSLDGIFIFFSLALCLSANLSVFDSLGYLSS